MRSLVLPAETKHVFQCCWWCLQRLNTWEVGRGLTGSHDPSLLSGGHRGQQRSFRRKPKWWSTLLKTHKCAHWMRLHISFFHNQVNPCCCHCLCTCVFVLCTLGEVETTDGRSSPHRAQFVAPARDWSSPKLQPSSCLFKISSRSLHSYN